MPSDWPAYAAEAPGLVERCVVEIQARPERFANRRESLKAKKPIVGKRSSTGSFRERHAASSSIRIHTFVSSE